MKIKKKERKYKRNVLSGGNLKRERERRKKDVYNLGPRDGSCVGPDMQKRGCRTELEYPRGLIWISISLRGQFSSRCFLPPGAVTYVSAWFCLHHGFSGNHRSKGLLSNATVTRTKRGRGRKKESTPRCPIKNPLCLPGERNDEQLGKKRIVNAAHLIRAAFNVKSDAPGVVFSLSIATLRGYSAQDGEKVLPRWE